MNIIAALKAEDSTLRLDGDDKWLVWDGQEWVVYKKEYRKSQGQVIYRGDSEEDAVATLIKEG